MKIFVIVKKHHEGYSMICPALDEKSASNKVLELRKEIEELNLRCREANKDYNFETDDYLDSPWDRMFHDKEIDSFEWENGLFASPEDYCVRKWNDSVKKFECSCSELGLEIDHKYSF